MKAMKKQSQGLDDRGVLFRMTSLRSDRPPVASLATTPVRRRPAAGKFTLLTIGIGAVILLSFDAVLRNLGMHMGPETAAVSFQRWLAEVEDDNRDANTQGEDNAEDINATLLGTVHTFFSPIDPATRLPTDKLNVTDRVMLDTWRAAWESQGWKTKILTIEDAKKHPDFDHYNKSLDAVPLGWNNYYNRLCYLRWLAMAAAGGGFMSDYDTVPIRHPPSSWSDIPDRFTVYGSGVPSLVSGTKAEWDRMARLLLETALTKTKADPDRHLWSDMMMLQELNEVKDKHYVMRHETLEGHNGLKLLPLKDEDCDFFRADGPAREGGYRLVHFSHYDMEEASQKGYYLRMGGPTWEEDWQYVLAHDRPIVMRQFLEAWSKTCEGKELKLKVKSSLEHEKEFNSDKKDVPVSGDSKTSEGHAHVRGYVQALDEMKE